MKKIAITQRLTENETYYEKRECLDVRWGQLFNRLDMLPVAVPIGFDIRRFLNGVKPDGLILTGGNDLFSINNSSLSEQRCKFEKELLAHFIDAGVPVLGVCRGMQVITEYFNGSLKEIQRHTAVSHDIEAREESRYYRWLKDIKNVNSYHNYAVENPGDNMTVSALSDDGVIEASEHKYLSIFAQMWHPERKENFCGKEIALLSAVFNSKEFK